MNYKNVYDDFNPRYPEHKQQMNQLKFNRDINIYVSDFIDETASTWRVFVTTYTYKDCMKLPLAESRETLPAYRNDLPCTWHNSAPTSDCGGNTHLCAPIKSACHIRRRKSCSGSGPLTYLPWLNTKSLR